MYCQKCGAMNAENAYKCSHCEEPLQGGVADAVPEKIPNYLAQSILVTLLCCLPLGIPAIVYSAQVNGKVQAGDIEGAREVSRKARKWAWWSLGVGLLVLLLYLIIGIAGVALEGL